MNEKQRENEKKIFDAIQDLKDSIFGLKQSYIPFCFDYSTESGYLLNTEKLNVFSQELAKLARTTKTYDDNFEPVIPLFFIVCIKFLTASCNPSDWLFLSIRKIAKTNDGTEDYPISTFDIMIKNSSVFLKGYYQDGIFWNEYDEFKTLMLEVDKDNFYQCIKNTIETFIDENNLNSLNDDKTTQSLLSKINRTSSVIARELQRNSISER